MRHDPLRRRSAIRASQSRCKALEPDNLYVVDMSFLVTASAVNPTLTVVANAIGDAEHPREDSARGHRYQPWPQKTQSDARAAVAVTGHWMRDH
jgi:GMC oxidoreductase